MQDSCIGAFRKRLRKRGYTDISIVRCKDKTKKDYKKFYIVSAVEPLAHQKVVVEYHIIDFYYRMR